MYSLIYQSVAGVHKIKIGGEMRATVRNMLEKAGLRIGKPNGNQLRGSTPYQVLKTGYLDQEWEVGLEWYLKRIKGPVVVDTGFISHQNFTKLLARLDFTTYGIDLNLFTGYYYNLHYLHNLVWNIMLPDESVDTIVANSLLEHLGLDYYDQPLAPDAERDTVNEFARILKPNGKLLMQVPYAKTHTVIYHKSDQFYRTYTRGMLEELTEPVFKIIDWTFYARGKGKWIEVNQEVASRIEQGSGFPVCLCYMEVVKR